MSSSDADKPTISVIVPNYNHARHLAARLESILGQTRSDFELVFLDDASTDDSLDVVEKYRADSRLRVSVNAENSGNPFAQWRKGLQRARGELVWIAESDDSAQPRFLERVAGVLEKHPEAGLATCRSVMIDEDDREVGLFDAYDWFADGARWREDYCNDGEDEVRRYLLHQNTIPNASAVVFRRRLVEDIVDLLPGFRIAGDWFCWVSILLRSGLCHVAEPLNRFRTGLPGSQRARTLGEGIGVTEAVRVVERIESEMALADRERVGARMSLVRLWLSLESQHPHGWARNREIRSLVSRGPFGALGPRLITAMLTGAALGSTLVSRVPGYRRFGAWARDRLRRFRPGDAAP